MDVATASAIQQSRIRADISTAVAVKSFQAQRQQGAGAVQLINAALSKTVTPGDALVAKATGLGGNCDCKG